MADLLKNMYNHDSLRELSLAIRAVYNAFSAEDFLQSTMDGSWDDLELKARVRQITLNLGKYLPADYETALSVIDNVLMDYASLGSGFFGIIFPDFVEVYGQDEKNWDVSINALERYTSHSSSEFAVRPFIIKHEERMMAQMYEWSKHENEHVRRLASEGSRPRLPWGQVLTNYQNDPRPILPILEQLKADPSLYVRKSVANNLNDISKTHPDLVIKLAKDWYGKNETTDWIVKRGCRTLLKKGDRDVLTLFGYHDAASVAVADFALSATSLSMGERITFSFSIWAKEATAIRLEYGVDYVKASGKRNRKIFQIAEASLEKDTKKAYTKNHSFAKLSTRKHYPGVHSIALIVNGTEREKLDFELHAKQ